jgi:2-polyprenyl-3-methyl-5-hydroxy-6-metoxy-1,4-benzoquinol methylase
MALYFHGNASLKFQHMFRVTRDYIIPYLETHGIMKRGMHVLEIGCGEGGVLKAFAGYGCHCTGMDLSESKIEHGKKIFSEDEDGERVHLFSANIYDQKTMDDFRGKFDLIVLKDTIEHIPDQEKVMHQLPVYLKEGGKLFFAFPPWNMPFGGHQQTATKKAGQLPWMHLLPRSMYKAFLKKVGEPAPTIESLMEIYDTGISINRFERIVKNTGYTILNRRLYLINPIYRFKFNMSPRVQNSFIAGIPLLRDFVSTTAYYILERKNIA